MTSKETIHAWADAWTKRDVEAVIALFTRDATYVSGMDGPIPDLPRAFRWAGRNWEEFTLTLHDVEVEEAGDIALAEVGYSIDGRLQGRQVAYDAAVTFVLRRDGGGWRIRRFHESALTKRSAGNGE